METKAGELEVTTEPVVKDYQVVNAKHPKKFKEQIKILIEQGWEPQGGVFIMYEDGKSFYQAMILKGEPNEQDEVSVEEATDAPGEGDLDFESPEDEPGERV